MAFIRPRVAMTPEHIEPPPSPPRGRAARGGRGQLGSGQDLRAKGRTAVPRPPDPARERTRPYERTPPPPFVVVWRRPYVGTVNLVDAHGVARVIRRYTATADEGLERIVRQMLTDVRAASRRRPELTIGVVQDGAPDIWNLLRPALTAEPMVSTWVEAIDKYHLLERLGAALALVEPDPKVTSWKGDVDVRDSAIDSVERWLTRRFSVDEHPSIPRAAGARRHR